MINYKQAGVDIDKADALTEIIRKTVKSDNIGMFAGLYDHPYIPDYSLAACCDGVGTKIIPLHANDMIETIAVDLIAMNLNDLICIGAAPIFFLDYFATHKLDVEITSRFVIALKKELAKYNCTLLGGETAELNDLVTAGHFDVGGFSVGIIKKDKILTAENTSCNDIVIGLKSSGPHSNGFTLIRKLHEEGLINDQYLLESLKPTYIYVNEILELCNKGLVKVCANITGGGIAGNLCRVIPQGLCAEIFEENIPEMPIFSKIKDVVGKDEAYKTFNMGVGMCLIVSPENQKEVMQICSKFEPFILGSIVNEKTDCRVRLG